VIASLVLRARRNLDHNLIASVVIVSRQPSEAVRGSADCQGFSAIRE
jgi:hypothetical protein